MAYLNRIEYEDIVRELDRYAVDPWLRTKDAVWVKKGAYNAPDSRSGGLSIVFKVKPKETGILPQSTRTYALRFWHTKPGKAEERFSYVAEYLRAHPLPWFVEHNYMRVAAKRDDSEVAASGMNWVEGVTLFAYLKAHYRDSRALLKLAAEFRTMMAGLHQNSIAHWDLQNGNLMITNPGCGDPELRLVDYDTLYVPTIPDHLLEDSRGVEHFQHPQRTPALKERGDYFSELVIYLSLLAYAEMPDAWDGEDNSDRLFFEDSDFLPPYASEHWSRLERSASAEVRALASTLRLACSQDPFDLKPLEDITGGSAFTRLFGGMGAVQVSEPRISTCPNGHTRTTEGELYCSIDNDLNSFFGKGMRCPQCAGCMPNHSSLSYCPRCGVPVH